MKDRKKCSDSKHPLDRKFATIEEAGQAKIEYIMANKPVDFLEKLKKAFEK